jgi:cytochrome c peroxidase
MLRYLLFLLLGILFTACTDDSSAPKGPEENPLVKIEIPKYLNKKLNITTGNAPTVNGVALGRMLFYDTQLSADNTVSCASCHKQENAFNEPIATSIGIRGQAVPRASMSLTNKIWESRYMWDGRHTSIEALVNDPITNPIEMGSDWNTLVSKIKADARYNGKFAAAFGANTEVTRENVSKALAQFIYTLQSTTSKYDRYLDGKEQLSPAEKRGFILFTTHPDPNRGVRGGNCSDCHTIGHLGGDNFEFNGFKNNGSIPSFTGNYDKGLEQFTGKASDRGKFKVTSLRNIALTAPYFHNGSAATLEAVLDHYNSEELFSRPLADTALTHGINVPGGTSLGLTRQEKADIIEFLKTLTDSSFINNKAHSNPF